MASQTATERGQAKLSTYNLKKHHLPRVGPKQLCASAHLECTHEADSSQLELNLESGNSYKNRDDTRAPNKDSGSYANVEIVI